MYVFLPSTLCSKEQCLIHAFDVHTLSENFDVRFFSGSINDEFLRSAPAGNADALVVIPTGCTLDDRSLLCLLAQNGTFLGCAHIRKQFLFHDVTYVLPVTNVFVSRVMPQGKTIAIHLASRLSHSLRLSGNFLRHIAFTYCLEGTVFCGSEHETVDRSDFFRGKDLRFSGLPPLPLNAADATLDVIASLPRASFRPVNSLDDNGQLKLYYLLRNTWRVNEVLVYFGCSPGDNILALLRQRRLGASGLAGLILVDPRPLQPSLFRYLIDLGLRVTTSFTPCRERLLFINAYYSSADAEDLADTLRNFSTDLTLLLFADIRSDDSTSRSYLLEDYLAVTLLHHIVPHFRCVKFVLKRKIFNNAVLKFFPHSNLIFEPSARLIYELREIGRFDASTSFSLSLYPRIAESVNELRRSLPQTSCIMTSISDDVLRAMYSCADDSVLYKVENRRQLLRTSNRAIHNSRFLLNLDVTYEDSLKTEHDAHVDLFYLTDRRNLSSPRLVQKALTSQLATLWIGTGYTSYGDFRFYDISAINMGILRQYLLHAFPLCTAFTAGPFFLFLMQVGALSPSHFQNLDFHLMGNFVIIVSYSFLDSISSDSRALLLSNDYPSMQSFGMRRTLNRLRRDGYFPLLTIDEYRAGLPDDPYSGHMIAFVLFLLISSDAILCSRFSIPFFDYLRWLLLLIGSWSVPKDELFGRDPEGRELRGPWHSSSDIRNTGQLLTRICGPGNEAVLPVVLSATEVALLRGEDRV